MSSSLPTIDPALTSEEATRQWWQTQYGQTLPDEVKQWMKAIAKREVLRARRDEHLLDDAQLHRVRESRRLCQTKLDNNIEALNRVALQQQRLQRATELNVALNKQRAILYDLNKKQASLMSQQNELERFEAFEAINGQFQRVHNLTKQIASARQQQSMLSPSIDEATREVADIDKRLVIEQAKTSDARKRAEAVRTNLITAQGLATKVETDIKRKDAYDAHLQHLRERTKQLQQQLEESRQANTGYQSRQADIRMKHQVLETHISMIEHGEAIIVKLANLSKAKEMKEKLNEQLNQATRQQTERNGLLGRLFQQSQQLQADIDRLQDEMQGHRNSIAGQDSYAMQKRAMSLQSRKLMLEMGLSLWTSIATGYEQMEQKNVFVTQLRHRSDQLNNEIDTLEAEVKSIQSTLDQKQYHLTLSKSQNVIELRADLEEGVPCTVCGATHHPFYSDTMLVQNSVISQLRAECDALSQELRGKRKRLHDSQLELHSIQGQIEMERNNLALLQQRQQKDTAEWRTFSSLDRTFIECSASTNRQARTAMMRQLIEKTTVDAEQAERDLDAFTYHLNAISNIGSELQKLQRELYDINTRLNEVNTGCQVVAGQTERLTEQLKLATQSYGQQYEALDRIITLPDWLRIWKDSSESLQLKIQDMMSQWKSQQDELRELQRHIDDMNITIDMLQRSLSASTMALTTGESLSKQLEQQITADQKMLAQLNEQDDITQQDSNAQAQLAQQLAQLELTQQQHNAAIQQLMELKAQYADLQTYIQQTEQLEAEQRVEIDVWMRRYNATHPPVQFAELQRTLSDTRDWNALRTDIRELKINLSVTQARIEHLRAELVALQAEGMNVSLDNAETEREALRTQAEELMAQQRSITQQMARYDEQLRWHEIAQTL